MRSKLSTALRFAQDEPGAAIAIGVLTIFVGAAIAAPLIAPGGSTQQVGPPFHPPSSAHILGLDDTGSDMVAVLIWGARVSLLVGVAAATLSTIFGGLVGIAAGYFGGVADGVLMRITDYFLVVPVVPLMMVVAAVWGPSLTHIILIIGLLLWTNTARVVRSEVKSVRTRLYVRRSAAMGARHSWILRRHIVPVIARLLVAMGILSIASAIFSEAALSFLGLGDPQTVSWGQEIAHAFARTAVTAGAWWVIVPPGLCIGIVVIAAHIVGDGLERQLTGRPHGSDWLVASGALGRGSRAE